jgi:hypothetical protein
MKRLHVFSGAFCRLATMVLLISSCSALYAQRSCPENCRGSDSPCSGLTGTNFTQCVKSCVQRCPAPPPPPQPTPDPGCSNRSIQGKITCTIYEPEVTKRETVYPNIQFAPNDIVDVKADGCVQTGGWGDTWKRYVNPTGDGTNDKYHGLIRIPTAKPAGSGLVRIQSVIGKLQTVTGADVPLSQLVLHLGYEDDGYSDNGYYAHDDGNDGQCSMTASNDGGPAHVTITIYRGVRPDTETSNYDFDVLSDSVDLNGLPYNPQWSWQRWVPNQGKIPSTSLCHEFSERPTVLDVPEPTMAPYFADCTDQTDLNNVDLPTENASLCYWRKGGPANTGSFVGHVNWFPVTLEGHAGWGDHATFPFGDDDYTFTFISDLPGNPLSVNGRPGLHIEFDSDETIDNFNSDEWIRLKNAVNGDNDNLKKQLFDGHTILTGMFGMDGEHDLKAELHPLFAIATRRDNYENDPGDEVWLMFVRNLGDEGFCSSQLWDSGFEDYTFRVPWHPGAIDVDVNWNKSIFDGTEGTSGPIVRVLAPPARDPAVYVTFHLGPSNSFPFIDGALHLEWRMRPGVIQPGVAATAPHVGHVPLATFAGSVAGNQRPEVDEVEHSLRATANQLTPAQRESVRQARAAAIVRRPVHRLPPGPAVQKLTAAPPVKRIAHLRAIKAGPATAKLAREAAEIRALCATTHNAPPGLPAEVCKGTVRDHRSR